MENAGKKMLKCIVDTNESEEVSPLKAEMARRLMAKSEPWRVIRSAYLLGTVDGVASNGNQPPTPWYEHTWAPPLAALVIVLVAAAALVASVASGC